MANIDIDLIEQNMDEIQEIIYDIKKLLDKRIEIIENFGKD